jgi:2-keto-3-deoxy-L-rhamnonate aldolase RhmA
VDAVEAIAAMPGLDALFVGRINLRIARGETDPDSQAVVAAYDACFQQDRSRASQSACLCPATEMWRAGKIKVRGYSCKDPITPPWALAPRPPAAAAGF